MVGALAAKLRAQVEFRRDFRHICWQREAVDAIRTLPDATQEDLARFMLALAKGASKLSDEEAPAIAEAESEIARGERVPPETASGWRRN